MAHFSGDQGLCAQLGLAGRDPFRGLAALWLGGDQEQVGGEGRGGGSSALCVTVQCVTCAL